MNQARQGDLFFLRCETIPNKVKKQKDGIIARGEVTGHTHAIRQGSKALLFIATGIAYIRALAETAIDHQEHETITLPPGLWEVKRQREYEPNGWRQVED